MKEGGDNVERSKKLGVLVAILGGISLMFSGVIYNSGVNAIIIGAYTVTMFIILSTLVVKMFLQLNGKKSTNEQRF